MSGIYKADMGAPPANTMDGRSAPGPMSKEERMGNRNIAPENRVNPRTVPANTKDGETATKKFAKGGSIDGCAQRGKTKGRMV